MGKSGGAVGERWGGASVELVVGQGPPYGSGRSSSCESRLPLYNTIRARSCWAALRLTSMSTPLIVRAISP